MEVKLGELELTDCAEISLDSSAVSAFDTTGAWLIERLRLAAQDHGIQFSHIDDDDRRARLVKVIAQDATVDAHAGAGVLRDLSWQVGRRVDCHR